MHERVLWMTMLVAAVWPSCRMTRGIGRIPGTIITRLMMMHNICRLQENITTVSCHLLLKAQNQLREVKTIAEKLVRVSKKLPPPGK